MALEYMLRVATDLEPSQVLDFLAHTLEIESGSDQLNAPGLIIYASNENERGRSIIKENFNFVPTVKVTLRLDKFDDTDVGKTYLLRGIIELLSKTQNDAVLLFNNEDVVLLNTGDLLILNSESGFWTSLRLSQVTLPYTMKSIVAL